MQVRADLECVLEQTFALDGVEVRESDRTRDRIATVRESVPKPVCVI